MIADKIYGKIRIKEPVLLKLLKSPPILRLKKISQYGVPDKYYHFKNYSRYEHSVGVMVLLRKRGAALEEQVAGLLHDVSVLAFSHIADWVFSKGADGIEDFHNTIHEKFVRETETPGILEKFNFSVGRILNEENFTLLEREIPDLCADRVDYALREFRYWLNPGIVNSCIKGLVNFNGEMVFADEKTAFDFSTNFLELQTRHWGGYEAMMRYHLFSQALKIALEKKIISESDFFRDEEFILIKIEESQCEEIEEILALLRSKELKGIGTTSGKRVVKKFRYVDPKIISNGKLVRLGKINPRFQRILNKHREISRKGLVV